MAVGPGCGVQGHRSDAHPSRCLRDRHSCSAALDQAADTGALLQLARWGPTWRCAGWPPPGPSAGCWAAASPLPRASWRFWGALPSPQPCTCTSSRCAPPSVQLDCVLLPQSLILLICCCRGRPQIPVLVSMPPMAGLGRLEATVPATVLQWAFTNPNGAAGLQTTASLVLCYAGVLNSPAACLHTSRAHAIICCAAGASGCCAGSHGRGHVRRQATAARAGCTGCAGSRGSLQGAQHPQLSYGLTDLESCLDA